MNTIKLDDRTIARLENLTREELEFEIRCYTSRIESGVAWNHEVLFGLIIRKCQELLDTTPDEPVADSLTFERVFDSSADLGDVEDQINNLNLPNEFGASFIEDGILAIGYLGDDEAVYVNPHTPPELWGFIAFDVWNLWKAGPQGAL